MQLGITLPSNFNADKIMTTFTPDHVWIKTPHYPKINDTILSIIKELKLLGAMVPLEAYFLQTKHLNISKNNETGKKPTLPHMELQETI